MNHLNKISGLILACGSLLPHVMLAQKPTPPLIVVQAANAPAPTPAPATSAQDAGSVAAVSKTLQGIKAANDETLKKQEAALQQLEELQKAAEQIKIFAHRSG